MTPRTTMPEAQLVLERDYEALRPKVTASVRGKLAGQGVHVDEADLDAVYNQAWHALYAQLTEGRKIDNAAGFLVVVAYRRAIEELRSSGKDTYHAELDESAGVDEDVPGLLDDQTRLRHLLEGMRERLTDRERAAAALCLIHGYSRPEVAEALGVSRKRIEKIMDGVQRKLTVLTADIDEGWCENRRSLISAYSLGLLAAGGERHALAVEHLRACSACRRFVATGRGLAAVLPPVGLPFVVLGTSGAGGATGAAAARLRGSQPRGRSLAVAGVTVAALVVAAGAVAITTSSSSDGLPTRGTERGVAASRGAGAVRGSGGAVAASTVARAVAPPASSTAGTAGRSSARARAERRAAARDRAVRRAAPATAPSAPSTPTPTVAAPVAPTPAPTSTPTPGPEPESKPKPQPIVTDGAQEFGPEQNPTARTPTPDPATTTAPDPTPTASTTRGP